MFSSFWVNSSFLLRLRGSGSLVKRRGPESARPIAPSGALIRMERTANIKTCEPRSKSSSDGFGYFLSVSNGTGPNAAWNSCETCLKWRGKRDCY